MFVRQSTMSILVNWHKKMGTFKANSDPARAVLLEFSMMSVATYFEDAFAVGVVQRVAKYRRDKHATQFVFLLESVA